MLPTPQTLPESALLDAIVFGIFIRVVTGELHPLDTFRHNLVRLGIASASGNSREIGITIPVPTGGNLKAELIMHEVAYGFCLGNSSSIILNGMRFLRYKMGEEACGEHGLDRQDNLIGATDEDTYSFLLQQLDIIRSIMDTFVSIVESAFPDHSEVREQTLWLRKAEACLDLNASDAIGLVRRLQNLPPPATVGSTTDNYRSQVGMDKGIPCIRWWNSKNGFVRKVYPKRRDLLRVELACDKRDAFRALCGERASMNTIGGEEAVHLLTAFITAAQPHVRSIVAHTRRAEVAEKSTSDLLVALLPLTSLIAGATRGRGRPIDPKTVIRARAALDMLLASGSVDLATTGHAAALRTILIDMCSDDGPLQRDGHRAIYALKPEYAVARTML